MKTSPDYFKEGDFKVGDIVEITFKNSTIVKVGNKGFPFEYKSSIKLITRPWRIA